MRSSPALFSPLAHHTPIARRPDGAIGRTPCTGSPRPPRRPGPQPDVCIPPALKGGLTFACAKGIERGALTVRDTLSSETIGGWDLKTGAEGWHGTCSSDKPSSSPSLCLRATTA